MRVLTREFDDVSWNDVYRIYFIGDDHIGHPGGSEKRLDKIVGVIADDPFAYWVGMGDHIHAIQKKDRRFDSAILPDWILDGKPDVVRSRLADLISVQVEKYVELVSPIAHKCLGILQGNHEYAVQKNDERGVHKEIVDKLRVAGYFPPEHDLSLGYSGWLLLKFCRSVSNGKRNGVSTFRVLTHHGASIAESKLREFTLTSDADIVTWGHSHKLDVSPYRVRAIDNSGNLSDYIKWSAWTGTFQDDVVPGVETWGEQKGHLAPMGCVRFTIRPYAQNRVSRIRGEVLIL